MPAKCPKCVLDRGKGAMDAWIVFTKKMRWIVVRLNKERVKKHKKVPKGIKIFLKSTKAFGKKNENKL